jgi:hypothetical protein
MTVFYISDLIIDSGTICIVDNNQKIMGKMVDGNFSPRKFCPENSRSYKRRRVDRNRRERTPEKIFVGVKISVLVRVVESHQTE